MALARSMTSSLVLELQHRHHRAEDLLAHDRHVVVAGVKYGRRHEKAVGEVTGRHALAADDELRPFRLAARDVAATRAACASR